MFFVGTCMRVELLGQKIYVWLRDTAKHFSRKVLVLVYILIIVSKNSSCASSALSELTWFVSLYNGSRSVGWVMVSHCSYFISMMINDDEILFICLLVIWISPLLGACSSLSCIFFFFLFGFHPFFSFFLFFSDLWN